MTRDSLIRYLTDHHRIDSSELSDETPLFSSGLIDSFGMVELITFIEKEEGFKMKPTDVNLDNMDTVGRIVAYAQRRAQ